MNMKKVCWKKIFAYMALAWIHGVIFNRTEASFGFKEKIHRLDWNGIEVIYIEDDKKPTFEISVYFADGALSDKEESGLTHYAFGNIYLGTPKYKKTEIDEIFDFSGMGNSTLVYHEYSIFRLNGFVKDRSSIIDMSCHILKEGNYPQNELEKNIEKNIVDIKDMVNSHESLAQRIFREVSLAGTPYSLPYTGKISSIQKFTSKNLRTHLDYFLKDVKKKFYIIGPREILTIKDEFMTKCGFHSSAKFVREIPTNDRPKQSDLDVVFVPLEVANQAQVIIGSYFSQNENINRNYDGIVSQYLGGGWSSPLYQELRVRTGYVYTPSIVIGQQKNYGRGLISANTRNETLIPMIQKALEIIKNSGGKNHKIPKNDFERSLKGYLGNYPFLFETNTAIIDTIMQYEHEKRSMNDLFNFQQLAGSATADDIAEIISKVFSKDKLIIFVLGQKGLEKDLEKLGRPVRVLDLNSFL